MTGTHDHHDGEFEHETCKQCERKQKIKAMRCGPERHSSFHDSLVGILPTRPKPKEDKSEVRHRLECRGKPRHQPPNLEFAVDSAHNFLDDKSELLPKTSQPDGNHNNNNNNIKPSNFKSKAVYCEVKLMELLGRRGRKRGPSRPASTRTLRTFTEPAFVASVQLLAEISDMDTPYSRVLRTILQNLEQAIYSNYVTPHAGGTFDQVPYFELVSRLEAQHQKMIEEQERWKAVVSEYQATTDSIQQHIEELNDLLVKEKAKVAELQKDLLTTQRSLRKATKQVTELDHKVTQSRALVLDASTDKAQYEEERSKYLNLHARYVDLTKEVHHLQQNLAVARQEAADGVPKELFNNLQNDFFDLQSKLQQAKKFERQAETMTPRPNWSQIRGGPFFGFPTTQQAAEICEENRELAQRSLDLEAECAAVTVALVEATQSKIIEKKGKKGKKK